MPLRKKATTRSTTGDAAAEAASAVLGMETDAESTPEGISDIGQSTLSLSPTPRASTMPPTPIRTTRSVVKRMVDEREAAAGQYVENCRRFELKVDPSVVIALRTGWHILQPTKNFAEGSMLPLSGIMEHNDHVSKFNLSFNSMRDPRFRAAGNGNSNARILNSILKENRCIRELDLSSTGLDDDGIREICDGIRENKSVEVLKLANNHFGEVGAHYLSEALYVNTSVRSLDISRNALNYNSMNAVMTCCGPKSIAVDIEGNFLFEEVLNAVTHGVAFLVALLGANIMITDAAETFSVNEHHFWACVIYSVSVMFLFLSSTLFHSFFMLPTPSRVLQVLDHAGIYMLIAGSYSPLMMVSLYHHYSAQVLICAEWVAAFCGICFAACTDLNHPMTTIVETTNFVLMGGGVLLIWPTVVQEMHPTAVALLLLGCGLYVVGIGFYALGITHRPVYHTIWHLFVVLAAAIHWFLIYFFVVDASLNSPMKHRIIEMVDEMEAAASQAYNLTQASLHPHQ